MNSDIDSFISLDLEVPLPVKNNVRGLGILRTFIITSAIVGQLIFVFSTIYYLALDQDSGNKEFLGVCSSIDTIEFCDFLMSWKLCSALGIFVGCVQTVLAIAAASFQRVETKSNIWCAAHGFFVVCLAPIFILTLSSHHKVRSFPIEEDDAESISTKQSVFILMTGLDALFSLISIIAIPLIYGLEVQLQYSVLINLE